MMTETVSDKCRTLRLNTCMRQLSAVMNMAAQKNWPAVRTIEHLLDLELEARKQTQILLRFKQSKLCETPTIDQFDFNFHSCRKNQKGKILQLLTLQFLVEKKDIILIGNPGVGKSFLAKTVAYAATQQGFKVLFTTAMDMINHLVAAESDHSLLKKLHHYACPQLLLIDELGYLPLGTRGSNLFFQVISQRHEKKSTLITTNLPFTDWGTIFDSTTVATAIADRLVYNSEVLILEGSSYRKRLRKTDAS
jgi:DNA replication protein DnaC